MKIHLDTSFLIRAMIRDTVQDLRLREWLTAGESVAITAIAWTEFLCGPVGPTDVELARELIREQVAYHEEDASLAARLYNQSGRRSRSLTDCMIAASCIRSEATLATTDAKDFQRLIPLGLRLLT
ncbi:MAG TPA: PIN domain-containing protein [Candidatus Eisenbacteria bacterium]